MEGFVMSQDAFMDSMVARGTLSGLSENGALALARIYTRTIKYWVYTSPELLRASYAEDTTVLRGEDQANVHYAIAEINFHLFREHADFIPTVSTTVYKVGGPNPMPELSGIPFIAPDRYATSGKVLYMNRNIASQIITEDFVATTFAKKSPAESVN